MRVLVTGMISGLDDEKFIQDVLATGQKDGLDVKYYNLIDEIERTGNKKHYKSQKTTYICHTHVNSGLELFSLISEYSTHR